MILALIILFLSALFLVWQGTLAYQIGFTLMATSLAAMIWKMIRSYQVRYRIRQETEERKAKWGGILTVVSGLSSYTGMPCHLFITRQDEIVVEDAATARVIPLSEIRRMALFHGRALEKLNDQQLMEALGFRTIPHFSGVRAWVARNPRARKRLLLVIRFQKPLNELEYSEMAVFSDIQNLGNLRSFALRPEVATKTAVLPKRVRDGKKKAKLVNGLPSTNRHALLGDFPSQGQRQDTHPRDLPWDTSHYLAGKPLHSEIGSFQEYTQGVDREALQKMNKQLTEPFIAAVLGESKQNNYRNDDKC